MTAGKVRKLRGYAVRSLKAFDGFEFELKGLDSDKVMIYDGRFLSRGGE